MIIQVNSILLLFELYILFTSCQLAKLIKVADADKSIYGFMAISRGHCLVVRLLVRH